MPKLSIKLALILVIVLIAVVPQLFSFQLSQARMRQMADQRETDRALAIARQASVALQERGRRLQQMARMLAGDGGLIQALKDGDAVQAEQRLQQAKNAAALDGASLEMVSARKLADSDRQVLPVRVDQNLLLQAVEPVSEGGVMLGAVRLKLAADDLLPMALIKEFDVGITFRGGGGLSQVVVGSPHIPVDAGLLAQVFSSGEPGWRVLTAQAHVQAYWPLIFTDQTYVMVVEIDSQQSYLQLGEAERSSALWVFAILIGGVLFGVLLLERLLAPLKGLRKRAEVVAMAISGAPVRVDADDEVVAVVQVLDDLTDRLLVQNNELLEAKRVADAASQAKSQFLSNMSHEIRTPMSAILGMSALMRQSGLSAAQSGQLEKIESAGQHLLDVINSILDLSKIEAGRFTLHCEDFRVADLIESLTAVIGGAARAKGLVFETDCTALPEALFGDVTCLRQSLLNYLGNAVKFTEQGSVRLSATVVETDGTEMLIRFDVVDTGPGLTVEQTGRVFDAFEQADNSMTRRHGGTGLGLTIVKRMAQMMGGEAGVDSTVGAGSRFWFTARVIVSETPEVQPVTQALLSAQEILQVQFAGCKVLLVEDEPVNREIVLHYLGMAGIETVVAEDGIQAVEAATREDFDVILMDMLMPRMDGLQATEAIRQLPEGSDVPIIALTANAFVEDRARCKAAGMDDFLAKPVLAETLYQRILVALRGH